MTFEEQEREWERKLEDIIIEMLHQTDEQDLAFVVSGDKVEKFIAAYSALVSDIKSIKQKSRLTIRLGSKT
jgi:hypothetical protein